MIPDWSLYRRYKLGDKLTIEGKRWTVVGLDPDWRLWVEVERKVNGASKRTWLLLVKFSWEDETKSLTRRREQYNGGGWRAHMRSPRQAPKPRQADA